MDFLEWFNQSSKLERRKCYCFVLQSMRLLSFQNKIKACYEIFRGIAYSRKTTPLEYMLDRKEIKAK